jgi:glycosidase
MEIASSYDNWQSPLPMQADSRSGWAVLRVAWPPGRYGYSILEDGSPRLDSTNPLTTFRSDEEVSLLTVEDCSGPEVIVDAIDRQTPGAEAASEVILVRATFREGNVGAPLEPSSVRVDAPSATVERADSGSGEIRLRLTGLPRGKHTFQLATTDTQGNPAETRFSVWTQAAASTWTESTIYEILVDRFRGDDGSVLPAPPTPGWRAGGSFDGVRREIEKGTFDELGVTTLWISPAYLTPNEARPGSDGHLYQGYHGYWPVDSRAVEPRLGGTTGLQALVDAAHRRGLRIILDLVLNHVDQENPRYRLHQNDGWFHTGSEGCICGDVGCSWATSIERCWFNPFLPDYRFENQDVMDLAVDDVTFWLSTFDVDGARLDAVPMMPRAISRRISDRIRRMSAPSRQVPLLGEIFAGGPSGIDSIRYYLGPAGLDGAFDFPLMSAFREVIAHDRAGFDQIARTLDETDRKLAGSGSSIARLIDNHDTTRFISEAAGDASRDPWTSPPPQPANQEPYQRLEMALALILTLPGIPVLYYGDEIALPGVADPDNRRVMPSLDDINGMQLHVRNLVHRLGGLRACSDALRRGERRDLVVLADAYAYLRDAGDGRPAVLLFSKSLVPATIRIANAPAGSYVDVLSGDAVSITTDGATVAMDPLSARALVLSTDACSLKGAIQ